MFAQPEAKARALQMFNGGARQSSPEEANARQGDFAHQVAGAVRPSPKVQDTLQRYTPAPGAGMPTLVRWLSALAVSRWGLEALADLCVHGRHSVQPYAYNIINSVSISLHPDDVKKLEMGLDAPAETFAASGAFPIPSRFWKDKGAYLAIMVSYAVITAIAILVVMKRKDVN